MCYNYALTPIEKELDIDLRTGSNKKVWKDPDFEILDPDPFYYVSGFSHSHMPVIYDDEYTGISWGKMRWGLIMPYARTEADLYKLSHNPLNSRDDSIFTKDVYNLKDPSTGRDNWDIIERRCIVPMTGFYDSYARTTADKYPFFIKLKSRDVFFVGGIWRQATDPATGEQVQCFSMITTGPNQKMKLIHNQKERMLNILPEGTEHLWLQEGLTPAEIKELIKPYPDDDMQAHPIDKFYNNSRNHRNVPEAYNEMTYEKLNPMLMELASID